MFEDAVRRTGGHADAGAHPPNIKLERDSPEILDVTPPKQDFKQEFGYNAGRTQMGGNIHNRRGREERDTGSVVITNIHFEVTPCQSTLFPRFVAHPIQQMSPAEQQKKIFPCTNTLQQYV